MNILCRVDGNSSIGSGHLMRCLALAQACKLDNINVNFVIQPSTEILCRSRLDWVGEIIILPEALSLSNEVDWIKDNIEIKSYQILLLDGYQFDADYRKQLKSLDLPMVLFDDNNNSGRLHADLIVNGAEQAKALNYIQTAPDANLCMGEKYRVLRQEFTTQSNIPWKQRKALTLIMGGSDVLNITLPLLRALETLNAKIPIDVITGAAYQHIDALTKFIRSCSLEIQHSHNCQFVANKFTNARLAVSTAGSSQFELLACGTPAILLVVADNQLNASQSLEEQGACIVYNCLEILKIEKLALEIIDLWQRAEQLEKMHLRAIDLSDTNGASRVVNCIKNLLV